MTKIKPVKFNSNRPNIKDIYIYIYNHKKSANFFEINGLCFIKNIKLDNYYFYYFYYDLNIQCTIYSTTIIIYIYIYRCIKSKMLFSILILNTKL